MHRFIFWKKKRGKRSAKMIMQIGTAANAPKELPSEGSCSLYSAKCPALEGLWAPCWETLPASFVSWLPGASSGTAWAWEGHHCRVPGEKWVLQGFCSGIGHDRGPLFPELRCSVPLRFSCPADYFLVFSTLETHLHTNIRLYTPSRGSSTPPKKLTWSSNVKYVSIA